MVTEVTLVTLGGGEGRSPEHGPGEQSATGAATNPQAY